MTSIEVPDWVVEVACHAAAKARGNYLWPDEWMDGDDATLANETRATIRASLTAALRAWVVPRGTTYYDTRDSSLPTQVDWEHPEPVAKQNVYTLRQEKPE